MALFALLSQRRGAVENGAANLDLDVDKVFPHALRLDDDAETRGLRGAHLTIAVTRQLVGNKRLRQRLRRCGVFTETMLGEPRIRLQRSRQRQVRSKRVIDEGDA